MKANKMCALALAALTLFGLNACKDKNDDKALELTPTSTTLKVGETEQLVANITVDEWKSSDEKIATVSNSGLVTAVAEGTAIISATANGTTKTCVVKVTANGGGGEAKEVKGSQIWPVILDATTAESVKSKIVASFAPNDVDQFLYVWDNTYAANDNPTGMNFYGNTEGFTAMTVTALGWSGCGFCLTKDGNGWEAAEALRAAIVANPDDYYLHLAIKSTDNYSHCFYMFGSEATKFVLGSKVVYDGAVYSDFTRDGSWQEFDIPMSKYATALSEAACVAGVNVFVILSEGIQGAQLNVDAIYFYKK